MTRAWLLVAACLTVAVPLGAQTAPPFGPAGLKMERTELEQMVVDLEISASADGYSGSIRERARRDAALIRDRLTNGDFRLGDRIVLEVQGEPDIPDTLTVEPGPRITIPLMGAIPLGGVLRSELETHLTNELRRYLTNPTVRAESLIRLGIIGSVGNAGFFTVPADMLLSEALMLAGGPGAGADLDNVHIERTGQVLWEGEEIQEVLAEGRTLDQLNLRAGDQIVVPTQPAGGSTFWQVVRWAVPFVASVVFGVTVFR